MTTETPKKNINITSSKTLSKLDKSTPNCDIFTETPALKDNSSSKLNSDISNNVTKYSDSSNLLDTPETKKSVHEVPHVTHQRSAFLCNDYVRNEVFDTFYKDYLEFKHYMNDIIKTVTPSSEMVTNLSNDNVSLQTKLKSLEEEIECVKNENINLKGDIKTQLKVTENLSRFENRHYGDSITNKEKVNVNYESDNLKNESQWQIAGHFTNTRKNTLERNKNLMKSTSN